MVYRPPFIKQLDGSTYAGLNCTMASAAMAIIRHTRGANPVGSAPWYPTSRYLRAATGDRSGGTTLAQADSVAIRLYNVNLDVELGMSWGEFGNRIERGEGAILQGWYGVFKGTSYDAAPGFSGNHAVYINEVRWNETLDRWEYLMYDPMADGRRDLPRGPKWIRESLLQKFAANLLVNGTTGARAGKGRAWAAFTRDTEAVILRHNAVKYGPKNLESKYDNVAIRRSPTLGGSISHRIDKGNLFRVYQIKKDGPTIEGSRVWYGNAEGTKWSHAKNFVGG